MVHGLAIFISAFLLFQVQLIVGKMLLPWFGGAPAVWTTCMLFFQALLLAGYAYAHWLNAASTRTQKRVHLALLAAAFALLGASWWKWGSPLLPIHAPSANAIDAPIANIFRLLIVSIGLPFFVLSTTSPLLQRWYALAGGVSPYRLYAASNAGSMLGLLSYPFAVEPMLTLRSQSWIWCGAFAAFASLCVWCMRILPRSTATSETRDEQTEADKPRFVTVALWILLSAVTSAMLLSVTNSLCQDIAVVPFLWVLPLALYLLTFILCFESTRWYQRRWFVLAAAISTVAVLIANFHGPKLSVLTHAICYSVFLLFFCMTCHGELVRLKPSPRRLTGFYLAIAAGGVLGALFVAIGAPLWFPGFWELHITVLAGWLVLTVVFARDKSSFFFQGDRWHFLLVAALVSYGVLKLIFQHVVPREHPVVKHELLWSVIGAIALTGLLAIALRRTRAGQSRIWPRVLVGAIIFLAECFLLNRTRSTYFSSVEVARNFYGAIRVTRSEVGVERRLRVLQLAHGYINHGFQFPEPPLRILPTSYYSTNSGLARAIRSHPRRSSGNETNFNIGVLGLGVGTIAAFASERDTVRFYEINPAVIDLSVRPQPRFSYLRDCRGKADVARGDARLSLERELARGEFGQFDVLVMDAFSGDSVPVHLLTVEAFEIYSKHMRDENSVIAVNISNRFLDFRDLMAAIGKRFQMQAIFIDSRGDPPDYTPSRWCLFVRDAQLANFPELQSSRMAYDPRPVAAWTDQFSNMLRLIK